MKGFTLNKHKVLGLITLIIIWTLSHIMMGNSVVLPSPIETTMALIEIITSSNFVITILTTLSRIIISFLVGLALALVLGIISAMGLCLKIVIGGEVLGQPSNSIGTSIQTEKMYLNTAGVLGWIIILVILSFVIDLATKIFIFSIKAIRKGLKDEYTVY